MSDWRIIEADCVEAMAAIPEASIDAVVCDPPYGIGFMGKTWDGPAIAAAAARDRERRANLGPESASRPGRTQPRSSSAFGNEAIIAGPVRGGRDFQAWCEAWAAEALRVLKPGGHLLAFGGTRTSHRLACAIEDAGFEIRDTIAWMYGSGFPKSLDVSKAIDKRRDDTVAIRAVTAYIAANRGGRSNRAIDAHFGFNGMAGHWTTEAPQASVPTWEQWEDLKALCGFDDAMDAEVWRLNGRKGMPGEAWDQRAVVGERRQRGRRDGPGAAEFNASSSEVEEITAPATSEAAEWEGWGTALKPAHEPIVVARKPLAGTVAGNVLEHGTGALNIDATRVGTDAQHKAKCESVVGLDSNRNGVAYGEWKGERESSWTPAGRWPANVVLDPDAAAMLDEQTGDVRSAGQYPGSTPNGGYGGFAGAGFQGPLYDDSGGPSRFFYVAKASSAERNAGLNGFEDREQRDIYNDGLQGPRPHTADDYEWQRKGAKNSHPTVKPIDLMRWLVRLVTPLGGTVLDPFAGSGTTGAAALLEGFTFVGIEREAEYAAIARARIAWWAAHPDGMELVRRLEHEREAKAKVDAGQLSLVLDGS